MTQRPLGIELVTVLALALALTPAAAASARLQEPAAPAKEDSQDVVTDTVTVTAQRVEQDLQDVPISMLAYEADDLERSAITDVQELATVAPGLELRGQSSTGGDAILFVRGIGSNTTGVGVESTVGFYVDGVYIPRPQGFLNEFLDLERVEVLRGPQGTLWGRNSTGGALNLVTQSPRAQFAGRLLAGYGEYDGPGHLDRQRLSLSLTGPLGKSVLGRVSASRALSDNYTLNELLASPGRNRDATSGRFALTFAPEDAFAITLRGDLTDDDHHNNFHLRPGATSPASVLGTLTRFFALELPPDPHRIASNVDPRSEYREGGLALDLQWSASPSWSLQSISSYRDLDASRSADVDGTPLDFVENDDLLDASWWSQEIKLDGGTDRIDWIGGVYLFHEQATNFTDVRTDQALFSVFFFASNPGLFLFDPGTFCSLGFVAPPNVCGIDYYHVWAPLAGLPPVGNQTRGFNTFDRNVDTDSYAGYGQVSWRATDRLTVTAGARFTQDDKSHSITAIDFTTFQPSTRAESDSWSAFTPKLDIEYQPNDRTLLYGSLSTGFKSGGFNSVSQQPSFDEETILSFEVGAKTTLAQGRAVINAALFDYDYDDLQVSVLFPDRQTVENAAAASVRGAEIDLRLRPDHRFEATLGIAVLDDQFDEFFSQDPLAVAAVQDELNRRGVFDPFTIGAAVAAVPVSDLSGNGLPNAPDLSVHAALQYTFELGRTGTLTARAEAHYTDEVAFDPFENFVQGSTTLLDAGLVYRAADGDWSLHLFGKNLGNEEYRLTQFFARVTSTLEVWAPPRSWGLRVGWSF